MPIYEFFCPDCNTVFNFYSSTVNTSKIPLCPRCQKRELKRLLSTFATLSGKNEQSESPDLPFDEAKLGEVFQAFEQQMGNDEGTDPRKMASLLRKLNQAMGGSEKMEEAINRMEAGEDPDKIAEEMGDDFFSESFFEEKKRQGKSPNNILYDETLYEL